MEPNIGTCDRIARLIIPLAIIYLIRGGGIFAKLLLVLCGMLISSAISGYCFAYRPLGIDTSKSCCCK